MSVQTLYADFKQSVDAQNPVDVLGSEVGGTVAVDLAKLPPVSQGLGQSWTVGQATLKGDPLKRDAEELPEIVGSKRRRLLGDHGVAWVQQEGLQPWQDVTLFDNRRNEFILEGTIGPNTRFFGHFAEGDVVGAVEFYVVFLFPDTALEEEGGIFADVYWPERADLVLTRPRILIFSHQTEAFHRTWEPGVHLLTDLELGPNLKRLSGRAEAEDLLFFGGEIGFASDQFTFRLCSWPVVKMSFDPGGVFVQGRLFIEDVTLDARTRPWEDDEDPDRDTIFDPAPAQPDPERPAFEAQFALVGKYRVGVFGPQTHVVTALPPDHGAASWNGFSQEPVQVQLDGLPAVTLDESWISTFFGSVRFGYFPLLDLVLTVDLPTGRLTSASTELEIPSFTIAENLPGPLELRPARLTRLVSWPFDDARRTLTVEVEGTVNVDSVAVEVRFDLLTGRLILATADGTPPGAIAASEWLQQALSSGVLAV